jgi:small nuclear ribonucleoprotein F
MLQSLYVPRILTASFTANQRVDGRIDKPILVRLKWGQTEYKGTLVSVDSYMNLQLSGTEEFVDGKSTGSLGQVLIRYELSPSRFRAVHGRRGMAEGI